MLDALPAAVLEALERVVARAVEIEVEAPVRVVRVLVVDAGAVDREPRAHAGRRRGTATAACSGTGPAAKLADSSTPPRNDCTRTGPCSVRVPSGTHHGPCASPGSSLDVERLALVIDRDVGQRALPQHAAALVVGEVDHDPGRLGEPPVELPVRFVDHVAHHHSSAGTTWVTTLIEEVDDRDERRVTVAAAEHHGGRAPREREVARRAAPVVHRRLRRRRRARACSRTRSSTIAIEIASASSSRDSIGWPLSSSRCATTPASRSTHASTARSRRSRTRRRARGDGRPSSAAA